MSKDDFDDFFDKNYYAYLSAPMLQFIKQEMKLEWDEANVKNCAEIVTVVLTNQVKSLPFLNEASSSVILIAWAVQQITACGRPESNLVRLLSCLFRVTDLPLSASDIGRIVSLTLKATVDVVIELHCSLLRWGHRKQFIKNLRKFYDH